jgi:hypothetical protein
MKPRTYWAIKKLIKHNPEANREAHSAKVKLWYPLEAGWKQVSHDDGDHIKDILNIICK